MSLTSILRVDTNYDFLGTRFAASVVRMVILHRCDVNWLGSRFLRKKYIPNESNNCINHTDNYRI